MKSMLREFQIERLNPLQIKDTLRKNSILYLPLGALEWHGLHLSNGLGSFTSHGICLRVASKTGRLVIPPQFYGMTGSIWHHLYTILMEEDLVLLKILQTTLQRLEASNIKKVLIFTNHFALRQLEALGVLKNEWNGLKKTLKMQVLSTSDCPDFKMEADHGVIFETSILAQLQPELVKLDNLPQKDISTANDVEGNSYGDHHRDPDNVMFGVLGEDPRNYSEQKAKIIIHKITMGHFSSPKIIMLSLFLVWDQTFIMFSFKTIFTK